MMNTVLELAKALAEGRQTSESLCREAIARAQTPGGEGRRVFLHLDPEKILAQARASDLQRKAGIVPSPLAGLPVSLKDLFDVAGETTSAGSLVFRDAPPARADAPVVARLRAAGAVIFGRTNLTEFAFSGIGINPHYDTPRNPYDRVTGRIPGGSSAGAAISVTDGMSVIGLGSDTGGSTRVPAALCGIVGYKPTKSRIPTDGVFPLASSLDSVGPMAASVACCAICDAVLAGEPPIAPQPARLDGLRLAVPETLVLDDLDQHVAADFSHALATLARAGTRIEHIPLRALAELAEINQRGGLAPMEAYYVHRDWLEADGDRYDPRVRWRILGGAKASAADYLWTLERRRAWIDRVRAQIEPFDAIVMPTVPCIAPAIADLVRDDDAFRRTNARVLRNTSVINFLDGCALSIPSHEPGAPPTGLTLAAAGGQDRRVFSIGVSIEAALRAPGTIDRGIGSN